MQKLKELFAPRDLTKGKPWIGIVLFSIPLLIGNFIQQLYSAVDAIVVGNFVGDTALGAVGLVFPIINIMIVLFMGIATGATIVVAQAFGAKNKLEISQCVGTVNTLTFISGIVIAVLGLLSVHPLLRMLDTPPEMFDMAADYLVIFLIGIVGMGYYNILGGILRGLGDSVGPLIYLIIASAMNVVLDIVFVVYFNMTTDGVALATIISQGFSAYLCFRRLSKMTDIVSLDKKYLKPEKNMVMRIVHLGVPASITTVIFSAAGLLAQSITNSFGINIVTAVTAVMRVDGFAMMPNFTFGIAATTFTAQNYGANRMDRIKIGITNTMLFALGTSTAITLLILFFGENLVRIFTNTEAVVHYAMQMLRMLSVGYVAFGATQVLMGVMRGVGETLKPMWASIIYTVVIRLPIAYLWVHFTVSPLLPQGDYNAIMGSLLVAWVIGFFITLVMFLRMKKKGCFDYILTEEEKG